jgi:hypothetical protein
MLEVSINRNCQAVPSMRDHVERIYEVIALECTRLGNTWYIGPTIFTAMHRGVCCGVVAPGFTTSVDFSRHQERG